MFLKPGIFHLFIKSALTFRLEKGNAANALISFVSFGDYNNVLMLLFFLSVYIPEMN